MTDVTPTQGNDPAQPPVMPPPAPLGTVTVIPAQEPTSVLPPSVMIGKLALQAISAAMGVVVAFGAHITAEQQAAVLALLTAVVPAALEIAYTMAHGRAITSGPQA